MNWNINDDDLNTYVHTCIIHRGTLSSKYVIYQISGLILSNFFRSTIMYNVDDQLKVYYRLLSPFRSNPFRFS